MPAARHGKQHACIARMQIDVLPAVVCLDPLLNPRLHPDGLLSQIQAILTQCLLVADSPCPVVACHALL